MEVKFYEQTPDYQLKFAVIIAKAHGKWVFCRHRQRDTYELPGGHREAKESILDAATRELQELSLIHILRCRRILDFIYIFYPYN